MPYSFVERGWKRITSQHWSRRGATSVLEGRALVFMVRHRARAVREHGMRVLGLTGSMMCALALSKDRSSRSALNRVRRQVTATSLAAGYSMHWRWIPSEWNPADRASRQLSGIGAACAQPPGLPQAPSDGPPRAARRGARRGPKPTEEKPAARDRGRERAEGEESGDAAKTPFRGELEADRDVGAHAARKALMQWARRRSATTGCATTS